jgi:uncharacterized membrane protein YheB (UPF0754 family)
MAEKQINITLNVDDELFNKLISDGVNALPKKNLDELLLDGLKSSFKSQLDRQFDRSSNNYYSNSVSQTFDKVLTTFDYDKYFGEVTKEISEHIKNNYESLITNSLANIVASKIFRSEEIYNLQEELRSHIEQTMNRY